MTLRPAGYRSHAPSALTMNPTLRLLRHPPFRNAYIVRGIAVWAGFRLVALFFQIPHPNPVEKALILAVTGAAVFLDARRRGEDLFLGNLGIPGRAIVACALAIPLVLELLVL